MGEMNRVQFVFVGIHPLFDAEAAVADTLVGFNDNRWPSAAAELRRIAALGFWNYSGHQMTQ